MDPSALKQILTSLRKNSPVETEEIEMVRHAYWFARIWYRRMDDRDKYWGHTIRLFHRLVKESRLLSPDLLCGVLLHHLPASLIISRFPAQIEETVRLLSIGSFSDPPLGEADWMPLAQAPGPLKVAKVLDQIDHLEHAEYSERQQLLKETVERIQPLADRTDEEIAALLRNTTQRVILGIPDPQTYRPDLWRRINNYLTANQDWIYILKAWLSTFISAPFYWLLSALTGSLCYFTSRGLYHAPWYIAFGFSIVSAIMFPLVFSL